MLLSVVLYGSRARGDNRATSDVDMLGIVEGGSLRREVSAGGTSMYHYPVDLLLRDSSKGNLFVLHIITEGKVLHDTLCCVDKIKEKFQYKKNYSDEILEASMIVEFILARKQLLSRKDVRKRLVWGIRTILISRAADQRVPIFSSNALTAFSKIPELKSAIDNRSANNVTELVGAALRVLKKFGSVKGIDFSWSTDKAFQRGIMKERGGIVADTLRFVQPAAIVKIQNRKRLANLGEDVVAYLG